MLFERWREIASKYAGRIALRDLSNGTQWSFSELARAAEEAPRSGSKVAFVQSHGPNFVVEVLQAWKNGQVVCPLESSQKPPAVEPGLPGDIVHLKTTSATTGAPHLVAFTASQLMADAQNIVLSMGLRADWLNIGVISLAHSYGYSNLVLPLLLHGIPLMLQESALPEALRRVGSLTEEVTLPAVPALWRAW